MKRVLLLMAGLACSYTAYASDLYSDRHAACMDQSNRVTVNIINCIGEELRAQDARLNRAYQELRGDLMNERRQELLTAQRAWIQYRDANCEFYASAGGSLAMIESNACVLRETAERAGELENLQGW